MGAAGVFGDESGYWEASLPTATVVGNGGDAERRLAGLVCSVRSERSVGSGSTVSELLQAWIVVASGSWAPTTIQFVRLVQWSTALHSQVGAIRVGELTPSVVDAAYVRLRVAGGGRGQGLSAGTLARVHVVLRSTLAQEQRWGWVFDNPVERAHCIKVRKSERQPPTPDEVATLIELSGSLRTTRCCTFSSPLPCRLGRGGRNFLALRWDTSTLYGVVWLSSVAGFEGPNGPVPAVVSQRLDHQRKSTTLDYYERTVPSSGDGHAADVMRSILDNARAAARFVALAESSLSG